MIKLLNCDCMEIPLVTKGKVGFNKGHKSKPWLGKSHSEQTKAKMRLARLKNNPMHKKEVVSKRSKTLMENGTFAKENNNTWKGGITKESIKIRNSDKYKLWRNQVFERDNYTCQDCNERSRKGKSVFLEGHHIKPFALHPELRFDISNGVTLCKQCHSKKPKGREINAKH